MNAHQKMLLDRLKFIDMCKQKGLEVTVIEDETIVTGDKQQIEKLVKSLLCQANLTS